MAFSVTCFSCHAPVAVEEADRGKSVRCDICWAEVRVPAAGTVPAVHGELKPSQPIVAKPIQSHEQHTQTLSNEPTKKSEPVPNHDDLIVAEILEDDDAPINKPKRPRSNTKKSEPASGASTLKWVLILGGLFMVIVVVGLSVAAYFVYTALNLPKENIQANQPELSDVPDHLESKQSRPMSSAGASGSASPVKNDHQPSSLAPPTSNPSPKASTTNTAWQLKWATYTDPMSFSVTMPPNVQKQPRLVNLDGEILRGQSFSSKEGHVTYRVEYYDLPEELAISPHQFTHRLYDPTLGNSPPKGLLIVTRLDGRSAVENRFSTFAPVIVTKSTQVGCRVFIVSISRNDREDGNFQSFDFNTVAQKFFDSVKISFDTGTPAPLSSKAPAAGPNPLPLGPGQGHQQTPKLNMPKLITRLDPFVASAFLTQSSRLLTISPTHSQTTLRIVSAESFKTLQTMTLPNVFQHLIVDEKSNRLILGGGPVLGPPDSMIGSNLRCEIHVYALDQLLASAGSGAERPKPLVSKAYPRKLSGLVLSPDGKSLFLGSNEPAKVPSTGQFTVEKLSVNTLSRLAEAPTELPIYGLRLSPDGTTLVTWLHPYSTSGLSVFSSKGNAPIEFYDAATLKKKTSVTNVGLVSDVQFLNRDRAVAIAVVESITKLFHITTAGERTELPPPNGPLRAPQGGFVSCDVPSQSPEARIVVTSRLGSSLDVFKLNLDASPPAIQAIGSAAVYPGVLITGPSRILPQGKALAIGSGLILDISSP